MGRVRDQHITRIEIWGRDWRPPNAGGILVVFERAIVETSRLHGVSVAAVVITEAISRRVILLFTSGGGLLRSGSLRLASCNAALAARPCSRRRIATPKLRKPTPTVAVLLAITRRALNAIPDCPVGKVPIRVLLALLSFPL